jgi:hypothetical protein
MPGARFGAGFRPRHFEEIVGQQWPIDWFEVVSDGYIDVGGPRRAMLERLRADYPVVLHGLSLSVAGSEPLRGEYLEGLRVLAKWLEPEWVSDHLCWTARDDRESHDLLPVAYTSEVLDLVAERVGRVQDVLQRPLVLENASAYVAFRDAEMGQAEFFAELCRRAGCAMLLDVNNLHVNAANLGIDPLRELAALPQEIVAYTHLAGHAVLADVLIDTHDARIPAQVWQLFEAAVRRFPAADVIVERDDNLPPFAEIAEEVEWARRHHAEALRKAPPAPTVIERSRPVVATGSAAPWSARQSEFWNLLVESAGDGDDAAAEQLLDTKLPVRAGRGMRVYGDAYAISHRRALAANFPALARVVSVDDFGRLAAAYLATHPPRDYDFRSLGARLADFVIHHQFTADYGVAPAALADLVTLEQARLEVVDAIDDAPPIDGARLAAVTPEQWGRVRFTFVRALRVVRASYDVLPAVEAVDRGERPPRPEPWAGAYLVHRAAGGVRAESLSLRQAEVLEGLAAGQSFGEACRAAGVDTEEGEAVMECARALVTACSLGLVLEVRLGGKD